MPGQKTSAVFNRQIRTDWDSFTVAVTVESIVPVLALKRFHAAGVSQLKSPFTAPSRPGEKKKTNRFNQRFASGVKQRIDTVHLQGKKRRCINRVTQASSKRPAMLPMPPFAPGTKPTKTRNRASKHLPSKFP